MPPATPSETGQRSFVTWMADMPRWKKGLVGGSVAFALIGGLMLLMQGANPTSGPGAGSEAVGSGGGPGASLLPGGTSTGTGAATTVNEEPVAKGVFRLGSSFLIGFCVGAFLRTAVKIASITVGFFLVALFLLEQAGFVVVDWVAIDQAWDGFWSHVATEWGGFQSFMTGRLPAAGLVTLGLYAGIKRH